MYDVVNSTELRLVKFKLKKVIVPPPVVTPPPVPPRRSTRSTSVADPTTGIPNKLDDHYEMDPEVDEFMLMNCFADLNDSVLWSAAAPV